MHFCMAYLCVLILFFPILQIQEIMVLEAVEEVGDMEGEVVIELL